ncbi:MAG TPA: hypothetical protein VL383_12510 [Gemmatimonadaceae bacterium]|nr:hypothetical protein [Gemmatimonadaceae bacterium]
MQVIHKALLGLAFVSLAGCERSGPVQPEARDLALMPSMSQGKGGGKPEIDPTYANGQTVYMIGTHLIVDARDSQPNLYEHAEELYLLVYPPGTNGAPITLTSGYQPQCNPCFHPGLPPNLVYHDHVISGAPGMGNNGTAGAYMAPWKMIVLVYNPAYVNAPGFTPIKSQADVDAAEAAGNVFLPIFPGPNHYEFETGNVLICPIVSNHA